MRILAVGDIHGCLTAFNALLAAVDPRPEDVLVTLGDYVDRGPNSREVLDLLIAIYASGRLIPLRGNHDVMMADALRDRAELDLWLACGGWQTLESYGFRSAHNADLRKIPQGHRDFLEHACVDWHETATHFFVHANAYPDIPVPEQPLYMLHWEKLGPTLPHVSGKVMVCGHTKQNDGLPLNRGHAVCIDTGAYGAGGWLTCLDVLTGRIWQANQKGAVRTGELPPEQESPEW